MNSKSVLNANKISGNILELGGVQVVPANLAIDPYNGTKRSTAPQSLRRADLRLRPMAASRLVVRS